LVHVEDWWKKNGVSDGDKRIYLATDEPEVWKEAITQHPSIQWAIFFLFIYSLFCYYLFFIFSY